MPLCYHCFREKVNNGPCPFCGYDDLDAMKKHPQALRPGTILNGRYTVGRVLGQGGFGITYLAQDYHTKERVAIKEYYPAEFAGRAPDGCSLAPHSEERTEGFAYGKAQFLEEARTLSNFIGNEHIVRIHSYFEENGTAYFVMDFIEGPSLDKYMRQFGGRLGVNEAKHLLLPLMEAMGEVHEKGIVHRDIAPDNIIVTGDGTAKLIDFGAARYSTGEKSKSLDVILKHGFAPYEQYMRRGRQGPWTDVYAMAATFYYAVTGKVPPEATERKEEDTLIPPSTLGVKIDDATEEALLKALEVRAADRFQSMADFCAAMRGETPAVRKPQAAPRSMEEAAAPAGRPAGSIAQPSSEQGTTPETGKKKSKLPLALAAVLVLAAVIFGVTRFGGSKAENPAVPDATASAIEETTEPEPTPDPQEVQLAETEEEKKEDSIQTYTVGYVLQHYEEMNGQTFCMEGYVSSIIDSIYLVDVLDDVLGYDQIEKSEEYSSGYVERYNMYSRYGLERNEIPRVEQYECVVVTPDWSSIDLKIQPKDRLIVLCRLDINDKNDSGETLSGGNRLSFTPYEITLEEKRETIDAIPLAKASIGDTVIFGSYEQDNDFSNGKEAIEWIVLDKNEESLLVISKYGLQCVPHCSSKVSTSWKTSLIRQWLNETFLNEAFTPEEASVIEIVKVSADKNPKYDKSPGDDTMDHIFLLSIKEADMYFNSDEARKSVLTAYAEPEYSEYVKTAYGENTFCWWWLRTPGQRTSYGACVVSDGSINFFGLGVLDTIAVRPAMWINLSA